MNQGSLGRGYQIINSLFFINNFLIKVEDKDGEEEHENIKAKLKDRDIKAHNVFKDNLASWMPRAFGKI